MGDAALTNLFPHFSRIPQFPFFVIRLGLEPKTPTLKVLCSTN